MLYLYKILKSRLNPPTMIIEPGHLGNVGTMLWTHAVYYTIGVVGVLGNSLVSVTTPTVL